MQNADDLEVITGALANYYSNGRPIEIPYQIVIHHQLDFPLTLNNR